MFTDEDAAYLIRRMQTNQVLLFLGAGFSAGATNSYGNQIPTGSEIGRIFWKELGWQGEYDDTPLSDMYEALLQSGMKHSTIQNLLESHFLCKVVPKNYDALTRVYWHRIYTINIDDVVRHCYARVGEPKLEILSFPNDEVGERDQFLRSVQLVHLHGRLPCKPDDITFSVTQYAQRAGKPQPLYEQFVRDYASLCTIFIGTQLSEPLLWQFIISRKERMADIAEHRSKSFLILPHISPAKLPLLSQFNTHYVQGKTEDFLEWLNSHGGAFPPRLEIVRSKAEDLVEHLESYRPSGRGADAFNDFFKSFARVPLRRPTQGYRSLFYLGTSPHWEDLALGLDVARPITTEIQQYIENALKDKKPASLVCIHGSAGCGKSTILRRAGMLLSEASHLVYLTNSEELPPVDTFKTFLELLNKRVILLFDNAENVLNYIPILYEALSGLPTPPIMVVASRTNDLDRAWAKQSRMANKYDFGVPNLTRQEITALIAKLDEHNLLGKLKGMSNAERIREFEIHSKKQILVALRTATCGYGFDQIIEDEFEKLEPQEAKYLYLAVALATDAGYRLSRTQFLGCAIVQPAEALNILARNLRDVVIPSGDNDDLLMLRHRLIAEHMIARASRPEMREAYIRLLLSLAAISKGRWQNTRTSRLFQALINHQVLFHRFHEDINEARAIYDALIRVLSTDPHIWLQYGSLESEGSGGNLQIAENYLNQADSLKPGDAFIQHARAYLFLKRGIHAATREAAFQWRDKGSKILEAEIESGFPADPYIVHIYCSQRYNFLLRWITEEQQLKEELSVLKSLSEKAADTWPLHRKLKELKQVITRAWWLLTIEKGRRPEFPGLMDS